MSQSYEIGTSLRIGTYGCPNLMRLGHPYDRHSLPTYLPIYLPTYQACDLYMPGCVVHTALSIDVFVVHGGGRATITKFVTEIDTTALEFCKPVITIRLAWCFIAKSSSKPSDW
ncbi:hypothetical protein EVAR_98567_1 [Eumeta japonica]|uniref:Uncharacterized protein n=1 Tax=Eumeta variegata TaxID=151549 RepID=A0A4C1YTZ6_EUMVA|nr:hypothetical protein EVAR_98567_1 [Eumeta japonica]